MFLINSALAIFIQAISLYTINFTDTNGKVQSFSSFKGKKILIVNTATGSSRVNQLAELQQLQTKYDKRLVIVVFPSNSFGNEPRSNGEIRSFCQSAYGTTLLIAEKGITNGEDKSSVYQWLTDKTKNGAIDIPVKGDFQKFLIDADGTIEGVFAGSVSPLSNQIQKAILAQ